MLLQSTTTPQLPDDFWLNKGDNIVLIGPPSSGKTYITQKIRHRFDRNSEWTAWFELPLDVGKELPPFDDDRSSSIIHAWTLRDIKFNLFDSFKYIFLFKEINFKKLELYYRTFMNDEDVSFNRFRQIMSDLPEYGFVIISL